MDSSVAVIAAVITTVVLLFVLLRTVVVTMKRGLLTDVDKKLMGKIPLRQTLAANFFGKSSRGHAQIRGNGALVLTDAELFFILAMPRREYSIPLDLITSITLPRSHLGKAMVKRLLKVEYQTTAGADSIAWALRDPEGWKDAVEKAMKRN